MSYRIQCTQKRKLQPCERPIMAHTSAFLLNLILLMGAPLLTGCASTLQTSIDVANGLGTVATEAAAQIEREAIDADRACLWTGAGMPSPLALDRQDACIAKERADFDKPLAAVARFRAAWRPLPFLVALAQSLDSVAGKPVLIQLESALPEIIAAAQALATAYQQMTAPALPALGRTP